MKDPEKTIRSSIIKMIGCVIFAIIGIGLAVSFTGTVKIIGIVLAAFAAICLIANGIVLAIAKLNNNR